MGLLSKKGVFARNAIEEEDDLAAEVARKGIKVSSLNRGDPTRYMRTPRYTLDAYIDAIKAGRTNYSTAQGIIELREAIAGRYGRMYGLRAGPDDVIVTAGVSEALSFINGTFIDPGSRAVLFKPFYPPYLANLRLNYGQPVFGRYDEGMGWGVHTEDLRRTLKDLRRSGAIRKVKYLLMTNPNNPTGTVLDRRTQKEIADIANEYGLFLISDEIYDEIVYNGARFESMSRFCKGMPYAILNGLSKAYNATGFRVGYIVVPEGDPVSASIKKRLIDFARVRISLNTPAQYAAAVAIGNHRAHQKELAVFVKTISERVNFAVDRLGESPHLKIIRPNGAYYIFAKVNGESAGLKDDSMIVDRLLREEGVQVAPGSGFGVPGHLRIVALAPKEILAYSIDKINAFLAKNAK